MHNHWINIQVKITLISLLSKTTQSVTLTWQSLEYIYVTNDPHTTTKTVPVVSSAWCLRHSRCVSDSDNRCSTSGSEFQRGVDARSIILFLITNHDAVQICRFPRASIKVCSLFYSEISIESRFNIAASLTFFFLLLLRFSRQRICDDYFADD